jgi:hypothetical protein
MVTHSAPRASLSEGPGVMFAPDAPPRAGLRLMTLTLASLSLILVAAALVLAGPAAAQTPERNLHPCQIWTSCTPVIGPWVVAEYPGNDAYSMECPVPKSPNGPPQLVVGSDAVFATSGEPPGPLLAGYQTDGGGIGSPFLDFALWEGNVGAPYKPAIGCAPHAAVSILFAQAAGIARRYSRRVRNVRIRPGGAVRVRLGCRRGKRLVRATSAVAFFTRRPPSRGVARALEHRRRSTRSFTRAFVAAPPGVGDNERVELQVAAYCARGGGPAADPPQTPAPCQWFGPKDGNPSNGSCTPVIGPWVAVDQVRQIYTMMCPSGSAVGSDAQATTVPGPVPMELPVLVATSGYQGLGLNFGVWDAADSSNDGGSYSPRSAARKERSRSSSTIPPPGIW